AARVRLIEQLDEPLLGDGLDSEAVGSLPVQDGLYLRDLLGRVRRHGPDQACADLHSALRVGGGAALQSELVVGGRDRRRGLLRRHHDLQRLLRLQLCGDVRRELEAAPAVRRRARRPRRLGFRGARAARGERGGGEDREPGTNKWSLAHGAPSLPGRPERLHPWKRSWRRFGRRPYSGLVAGSTARRRCRQTRSAQPAVRALVGDFWIGFELDHVLVAVVDLAKAARELEARYGLSSIEGGRHAGWGTANRIVPLGNS